MTIMLKEDAAVTLVPECVHPWKSTFIFSHLAIRPSQINQCLRNRRSGRWLAPRCASITELQWFLSHGPERAACQDAPQLNDKQGKHKLHYRSFLYLLIWIRKKGTNPCGLTTVSKWTLSAWNDRGRVLTRKGPTSSHQICGLCLFK